MRPSRSPVRCRVPIVAALAAASSCLAAPAAAEEMLVMDWNPREVTEADRGFPKELPVLFEAANGDWTAPVDYAHGQLFYRAELRSMPTSQSMLLQWCVHQDGIAKEECGSMSPQFTAPVSGPPVVVTWDSAVDTMWELPSGAVDWSRPRDQYFVPIRKSADEYISDYPQLNGGNLWAGENPADWYPMVVRLSCVVVSSGATFSGWETYVEPPDGGEPDAGEPDGGGPADAATDGGADAEPPDAATGPGSSPGGDAASDEGCGCRSAPPRHPGLRGSALAWPAILLARAARRRREAAQLSGWSCASMVRPCRRSPLAAERLHFHPLDDAQTTAIRPADLLRFVRACGHEPVMVDLGSLPPAG